VPEDRPAAATAPDAEEVEREALAPAGLVEGGADPVVAVDVADGVRERSDARQRFGLVAEEEEVGGAEAGASRRRSRRTST